MRKSFYFLPFGMVVGGMFVFEPETFYFICKLICKAEILKFSNISSFLSCDKYFLCTNFLKIAKIAATRHNREVI